MRPWGLVHSNVVGPSRRWVQPPVVLARWWRRHKGREVPGLGGAEGPGGDVVQVAGPGGSGAADEHAGGVQQPGLLVLGGGGPVAVGAEVLGEIVDRLDGHLGAGGGAPVGELLAGGQQRRLDFGLREGQDPPDDVSGTFTTVGGDVRSRQERPDDDPARVRPQTDTRPGDRDSAHGCIARTYAPVKSPSLTRRSRREE